MVKYTVSKGELMASAKNVLLAIMQLFVFLIYGQDVRYETFGIWVSTTGPKLVKSTVPLIYL